MSLALYRKYRPATFAELKGQEHVAEPLQQALRNGRINHAYLFSGPRGCGKTSSARILARSLNCEKGPTPDPCGECDSCVALGPSGTGHIDVIEIDAASHGGVDDARDLRERAFFAPVAARFKVYIIDEAHMVTREGFNALLKLVEEPPPHLKFVFATTEPEKVIGTIRSRTHHYPFRLIPPGVLQDLVEEILRAEDVPYETSALPLAVRAGAGSARDTLSILDQLLAGSDEKGITYARAVSLLGYTDSALLDEVIAAFAARDGAAVFASIDRVVESGQDPRRFTADLLERVRDLVILSNVPEAGGTGLLNVPPDELEAMRRQASSMGPGELTRAADLLHTGLTEMRGATSPRLLLELICARILLPAAYEDEASLFARLDRLERRPPHPGGISPAVATAPPPAAPGQGTQEQGRGGAVQTRGDHTPPSQGGDPTSSVNHRPSTTPPEHGSVDNRHSTPRADSPGNAHGTPPADSSASAPRGPAGGAPAAPQPAAGGMDFGAVQRLWPDVVEAVKQKSRATWMTIMSGVQPVSLDGKVLTLGFDAEGRRLGFVNGGRDTVLREVFKERMGVDWRIETVVGGSGSGSAGGGAGGAGGGGRPSNQGPGSGGRSGAGNGPSGGFGSAQSSGFGSGGGSPAGGFGSAPEAQAPQPASQAPRQNTNPVPRPANGNGEARRADPGPMPPPPDDPPPPPEPAPVDESDEVDPEGDADADGSEAEMNGMALIERELGGKVIREIDNSNQ